MRARVCGGIAVKRACVNACLRFAYAVVRGRGNVVYVCAKKGCMCDHGSDE